MGWGLCQPHLQLQHSSSLPRAIAGAWAGAAAPRAGPQEQGGCCFFGAVVSSPSAGSATSHQVSHQSMKSCYPTTQPSDSPQPLGAQQPSEPKSPSSATWILLSLWTLESSGYSGKSKESPREYTGSALTELSPTGVGLSRC